MDRICQRCGSNSVYDEEHMLFGCTALEQERLEHPSLFERDGLSLAISRRRTLQRWQLLYTIASTLAMFDSKRCQIVVQ